jgi:hypothetical protein
MHLPFPRYQANVYKDGDRFTSFKKVVRDMQAPVQLFSFHSTSKVSKAL